MKGFYLFWKYLYSCTNYNNTVFGIFNKNIKLKIVYPNIVHIIYLCFTTISGRSFKNLNLKKL